MLTTHLNQGLLGKLQKINRRKAGEASASIPIIKEIMVCQINESNKKNSPLGEYNENSISTPNFSVKRRLVETEDALIQRMINYLEDLMLRALLIHIEENFENSTTLRKLALCDDKSTVSYREVKRMLVSGKFVTKMCVDKVNHITRLAMNEFALYPHKDRGPLSLQGFSSLVEKIEKFCEICPENLHLLFGTIPVRVGDNLHNMMVFVQGGQPSQINIFSKSFPYRKDPSYSNTNNYSFSSSYDRDDAKKIKSIALADQEDQIKLQGMNVCYGGSVICKTAGGQIYHMAVDICMDHHAVVAKNLMIKKLKLAQVKHEEILSNNVSYVVISNTTNIDCDCCPSFTFTQVDPLKLQSQYVEGGVIKTLSPESTQEIKIPIFGSCAQITIYPNKKVGVYVDHIQQELSAYNENFIYLKSLSDYRRYRPLDCVAIQAEAIKYIKNLFFKRMEIFLKGNLDNTVKDYIKDQQEKIKSEKIECLEFINELIQLKEKKENEYRIFSNEKSQLTSLINLTIRQLEQQLSEHLDILFSNPSLIEQHALKKERLFIQALLIDHRPWLSRLIAETPEIVNEIELLDDYPIFVAAKNKRGDLVQFLVDQGARLTRKNKDKESILLAALRLKPSDVVLNVARKFIPFLEKEKKTKNKQATNLMFEFLVSLSDSYPNEDKWLFIEIMKNNPSLAHYKDEQGNTLLHRMIENGCLWIVMKLFEHDPDPAIRNKENKSCYDLVIEKSNEQLFQELYPKNQDIQFATHFLKSYIHVSNIIKRVDSSSYDYEYRKSRFIAGIDSIASLVKDRCEEMVRQLSGSERFYLLENKLNINFYQVVLKACSLKKLIEFVREGKAGVYFFEFMPQELFLRFSMSARNEIRKNALKKLNESKSVTANFIKKIENLFIPHSDITVLDKLNYQLLLLQRSIDNCKISDGNEAVTFTFNVNEIVKSISMLFGLHPELLLDERIQCEMIILLAKLNDDAVLDFKMRNAFVVIMVHEYFRDRDFSQPSVMQSTCDFVKKILTETVQISDASVVIKLIDYIPDGVQLRDVNGNGLLHIAVKFQNTSLLAHLLTKKMDLSVKNNLGKTAFEMSISKELFEIFYPHVNNKIDFAIEFLKKSTPCFLRLNQKFVEVISNEIDQVIALLPRDIKIQMLQREINGQFYSQLLKSMTPDEMAILFAGTDVSSWNECYWVEYLVNNMDINLFLSYPKELQLSIVNKVHGFLPHRRYYLLSLDSVFENKINSFLLSFDFVDKSPLFVYKIRVLAESVLGDKIRTANAAKAQEFLDCICSLMNDPSIKVSQETQMSFLQSMNKLLDHLPLQFKSFSESFSKARFLQLDNQEIKKNYDALVETLSKVCLTEIKMKVRSQDGWHTFFRKKSASSHLMNDVVAVIDKTSKEKTTWVDAKKEVERLLITKPKAHPQSALNAFYEDVRCHMALSL